MEEGFIKGLEKKYNITIAGQLKEILLFCENDPIHFYEQRRLLSIDEILNYNLELQIEDKNIIPLVDCYDNDFLIYDVESKTFMFCYIVDGIKYDKLNDINEFIELLKNYKR